MKKLLGIILIILLTQAQTHANTEEIIPNDTVTVTRKIQNKQPKTIKIEQNNLQNKTPDTKKRTQTKFTELTIYNQPKAEKTENKTNTKPTEKKKCKDDPKSPCNLRKAKPAKPAKVIPRIKIKERQYIPARPARPIPIIPCT